MLTYTLDHISRECRGYVTLEDRSQIKIEVSILSMLGSKLDERANSFKPVKFNINANLEEAGRSVNKVSLRFAFTIITNPRVVKYQVEGATELKGSLELIKKVMMPHPSTRVPNVLYDIYQQVYASIFVLSKTIDSPCPSPELLSTSPVAPSDGQDVQQDSATETEKLVAPDEEISA